MIMAALFPHHSHMPPERNERKVGKKKGLQGETPGESRDELKARTAAQKVEQQEQRVKAQQRALLHAAPSNVHHMSTRQKAAASVTSKPRTPSPSRSSSSESSSSSSTSSSPSKEKDDKTEEREVPEEPPKAQDPPPPMPEPAKQPSAFYKLARRLSQKTTVDIPAHPSKEAQEALEMPPPDMEPLPVDPPREHESGASSYASAEEPDEADTSSSKRRRSWASLTPSAVSEDEGGHEHLDLQSHDPRPPSVAHVRMGTGFGYGNKFLARRRTTRIDKTSHPEY